MNRRDFHRADYDMTGFQHPEAILRYKQLLAETSTTHFLRLLTELQDFLRKLPEDQEPRLHCELTVIKFWALKTLLETTAPLALCAIRELSPESLPVDQPSDEATDDDQKRYN